MTNKRLKEISMIFSIVLILSVAGNLIYASSRKLEEPIFVEQFNDECYRDSYYEKMAIVYMTDVNDSRRMTSVYFEGLDREIILSQSSYFSFETLLDNSNSTNPYNDLIGRYYTKKEAYFDLQLTEEEVARLEEEGCITLDKAIAYYDDGTKQAFDFGRYQIQSQAYWEDHNMLSSAGGGGDSFHIDYRLDEPILIKSLDLSTFLPHQDYIKMTMKFDYGEALSYEELMALDEDVEVRSSIQINLTNRNVDDQIAWRYFMLDFPITYEKAGATYEDWIYLPYFNQYKTSLSVEEYVDYRRMNHE